MKKLLLLLSLSLLLACGDDKEKGTATLVLTNPLEIERIDEFVVIDRQTIEGKTGKISDGQVVVLSANGTIIPSQQDDMDLDGQWDEVAFVHDFGPKEEIEISLRVGAASDLPEFKNRTNVRFAKLIVKGEKYEEMTTAARIQGVNTENTQKYFQYEGPGWENDKVGFRNYFDERNGMDIWGKITTDMVLDRVGINDNYHVLQPWGMDILKVANSLGAGALALHYKDSLYRVTAPEGASYELVAEGPVRSIFNFNFDRIALDGTSVALKHQISIVAGEYAYRNNIIVENAPSGLNIVTGIVNLQTENMYSLEADGAQAVYTHDKQSFDNEYLGMAVITSRKGFKDAFATPETGPGITETFAVTMEPDYEHGTDFRFYACWEKSDPSFADRNSFEQFVKNEALRYSSPVSVDFK